jgi:hypothetical protein
VVVVVVVRGEESEEGGKAISCRGDCGDFAPGLRRIIKVQWRGEVFELAAAGSWP